MALAAQVRRAPPAVRVRPFPAPIMEKGKPIESRPPEKSDDKPAFAGQTRAPDEATAPRFNLLDCPNDSCSCCSGGSPDGKACSHHGGAVDVSWTGSCTP